MSLDGSSDLDVDTNRDVISQFDMNFQYGSVVIELEIKFPTLRVFKDAMKDYNIHLGREVKWIKNDANRAKAICKDECPWEIQCSINNRTNSFQVNKFVDVHTGARSFKNKQADRRCVPQKLVETIREHPNLDGPRALYEKIASSSCWGCYDS